MRFTKIMLAGLAMGTMAGSVSAQSAKSRAREEASARTYYRSSSAEDRAALGVNTTSSGRRDTLGLLITSVVPGSPAEKAGLEEGNRIASINGVSLTLSRADAGEPDMNGLMTRRLVRELRKITPGQDADLRVYANGQTRTVKVKTVDAEELSELEHRNNRRMDIDEDERAVVGLSFGGGSSKRDTLGIFIVSITEDGPAAKAGLEEGNRIAAINGQDLRVAREDAGDGFMMNAKANRFRRVMRTIKPGESVDLRIYANGQFRNVKLTTVASSDLYRSSRSRGFFGEGGNFVFPRVTTPRAPRVRSAPVIIRSPNRMSIDYDDDFQYEGDYKIALEHAAEAAHAAVRAIEPAMARAAVAAEHFAHEAVEGIEPAMARAAEAAERAAHDAVGAFGGTRVRAPRAASLLDRDDRCRASNTSATTQWREIATNSRSRSLNVSGYGETYTLQIPGLCVTKVNADLASYFGQGAERGLLVLQADEPFDQLRAGDILLTVNGKPVRNGDGARITFSADERNTIEFLRKGAKMTAVVEVEK